MSTKKTFRNIDADLMNPLDPEYDNMCFSCEHYEDYGPVAGRFNDYNGRCKCDKHECDALVICTIGKYKKVSL